MAGRAGETGRSQPYAPQAAAFAGYRPAASAPGLAHAGNARHRDRWTFPSRLWRWPTISISPSLPTRTSRRSRRATTISTPSSRICLQDMNVRGVEPAPAAQAQPNSYSAASYHSDYFDDRPAVAAGAAVAAAAAACSVLAGDYDPAYSDAPTGAAGQGARAGQQPELTDMEFAYDPTSTRKSPARPIRRLPSVRARAVASVVAAIVGGVRAAGWCCGIRPVVRRRQGFARSRAGQGRSVAGQGQAGESGRHNHPEPGQQGL